MTRRLKDERLDLGIAAHHAVERHGVGRREAVSQRYEVSVMPLGLRGAIATRGFLAPRRDVGSRRVDAHGLAHAALEKLEGERPDAGSDVEQAVARPPAAVTPSRRRLVVAAGPRLRYWSRSRRARRAVNFPSIVAQVPEQQELMTQRPA